MKLTVIDLKFLNTSKVIAAFLVQTGQRNILIETGPTTTLPALNEGLKSKGLDTRDITDVLLTHIHFDHAGAAWYLADKGANIYLHPAGYPHLNKPEKLVESARRIYKEQMDELWGDIRPIPKEKLKAVTDLETIDLGSVTWVAHHTPGHAKHHIAWQLDDILFTGDVAGVSIKDGVVVPPCPPPDIDLEAWDQSLKRIRKLKPNKLYLTHFGAIRRVEEHLSQLEEELHYWAKWIKNQGLDKNPEELIPDFVEMTESRLKKHGLNIDWIGRFHKANPPEMSVTGLQRYWKKKGFKQD